MVASHILPVTDEQAAACQAPRLEFGNVKEREVCKMAGNSMSAPCVAAVLLAAIMALDLQ